MQKSNFGISVGVVGAAAYLLSLFGGYIPTLLLVGYVMLFEPNQWLKRTALKAGVITFMFSVLYALIGLLPDALSTLHSFFALFNGRLSVPFINDLCHVLNNVANLGETCLLLALAIKALDMKTIVISFVDNFVGKCTE
jgi:hypothetical protein